MSTLRTISLPTLLLTVVVAACSGGGSASPSPDPGGSPTPPPTAAPSNPGGGTAPSEPLPGDLADRLLDPAITLVHPMPNLLNLHPVQIEKLTAASDGRRVAVRADWTSGVEPCYALAGVTVERDGTTITITVTEGNGPGDVVCIEIAQMKGTIVDLGELEPGTYTVQGPAGIPSISVTVG